MAFSNANNDCRRKNERAEKQQTRSNRDWYTLCIITFKQL